MHKTSSNLTELNCFTKTVVLILSQAILVYLHLSNDTNLGPVCNMLMHHIQPRGIFDVVREFYRQNEFRSGFYLHLKFRVHVYSIVLVTR